MDTKTMNLNFGNDAQQLKDIVRSTAEMAINMEDTLNKMLQWKDSVEDAIHSHRNYINEQLQEVRDTTNHLREFMTETGAARMRQEIQEAVSAGHEHVKVLQDLSNQQLQNLQKENEHYKKLAEKSFDRLDRASTYTVKNISEAVGSFRISDFQKMTEQSVEKVEEASFSAVQKLGNVLHWFHWKNLMFATGLSVLVVLSMGMYMNSEWPWENHHAALLERSEGKVLINAWPHLSRSEQEHILKNSESFS